VERSLDSTLVSARQVQVLRLDNKQIDSVMIKADFFADFTPTAFK
jgi:hypothetical protein